MSQSPPLSPVRSCRHCLLLTIFGLTLFVLAGCSGDDHAAPVIPDVRVDQPDVGPAVQDGVDGGTTTIDPASPDVEDNTIEPSVLPQTKFSRVFVASNGSDDRSGENAQQSVASVDKAVSLLAPGGTIVFQPGTYEPLRIIGINGAAGSPIRIEAAGSVEFRDNDYDSAAGILIRDSRHVEVVGMRTRRSLWGIYVENAHHVTLRGNNVGDVGQEGIRIKGGSSNIRIDSNVVADTGRRAKSGGANGEGIYLGTGTPGGVDHVKNIVVINNQIRRVTDEAIDVKRPASNIDIIGNTISDVVTQTSGAIVVHLNGDQGGDPKVNIERNVIRNVTRSSPHRDGNCIVSQVTVRIVNNVLHNCQHRGIFLRGSAGVATVMHNTLLNTGDLGTIVDEGRGMSIINENNLGADGSANRKPGNDVFVNAGNGNYRIRDAAASNLKSAPNKGVNNDLLGARRPGAGAVTFGAVEAAGATPTATTTVAPATTNAPATVEAAAPAPTPTSPPTTQRLAAPRRTTTTVRAAVTTPERAPATTATRSVNEVSRTPITSPAGTTDAVGPQPTANSNSQIPAANSTATTATPGRAIVSPTDATPYVPGRGPEVSPLLEQIACVDSFVCNWAPFL